MLNIIAVLLCTAYCTGETSPKLWGSRVVSKPTGPSDTINYQVSADTRSFVHTATGSYEIVFENGSCIVDDKIWGSPCQKDKDTVNITVNDVNLQKAIQIVAGTNDDPFTLSTVFAPKCKFPPLATGEADPKTSFPLSRFVKDQQSFQLDFAVKGADSENTVELRRGSSILCNWFGVNVEINQSSVCVELKKDKKSDLRVFHGVFTPPSDVPRDSFLWLTNKSALAITVDYTQSGISPEVAECNQYGGIQFPTTSSGSALTSTTSVPTTSSGSALTYTISVVLGTAIMLTYLGR